MDRRKNLILNSQYDYMTSQVPSGSTMMRWAYAPPPTPPRPDSRPKFMHVSYPLNGKFPQSEEPNQPQNLNVRDPVLLYLWLPCQGLFKNIAYVGSMGNFDRSCICVFACQTPGYIVFEVLAPKASQKYSTCMVHSDW